MHVRGAQIQSAGMQHAGGGATPHNVCEQYL
jgi:hypothetical protein